MTLEEFFRWKAYDRLYGLPDSWLRTMVATQVKDIQQINPIPETVTPGHRMKKQQDPHAMWAIITSSAQAANLKFKR